MTAPDGQRWVLLEPPTTVAHFWSRELRALDDAWERQVGGVDGLIVVLCSADFHFDAIVDLEVWAGEPSPEQDDHDHIVDIDLDVPHGVIYVQATETSELAWAAWLRTPGPYRVRIEGRGYTAQQDTRRVMGEHDAYRLQLWPRSIDEPAVLRREWPGWHRLINPMPTDA